MGLLMQCAAKDSPYGAEIADAYVRIQSIQARKGTSVAELAMYASRDAYVKGALPLRKWGLGIPTEELTGVLWEAAYRAVKKTYPTATDVLGDAEEDRYVDGTPDSVVGPFHVYPAQAPQSSLGSIEVPPAVAVAAVATAPANGS